MARKRFSHLPGLPDGIADLDRGLDEALGREGQHHVELGARSERSLGENDVGARGERAIDDADIVLGQQRLG